MQNKMSARKQRIAKRLEVLGVVFDGQKSGGVYTINNVSFSTLDEIEAYIDGLEKANEEQSVAEAGVVETMATKKCSEHKEEPMQTNKNWRDWENAMRDKEKQRIAALRRRDKARTTTTLSDMTPEELRTEHAALREKGLRSGYDTRRIDDIEKELARRARKHFEPERYERRA